MDQCIVCKVSTNKYKCPRCYFRYCSVDCCRVHKESCQEKAKTVPAQAPHTAHSVQSSNDSYRIERLAPRIHNDEDSTEDIVPQHLLAQLGESQEVLETLSNPHVRAMMENLVNSEHPEEEIGRAMREPIFAEFADKCLKTVDKEYLQLEPSDGS